MTETEEWRPVVGYEGLYSVSSLGRVRRDSPSARGGRSAPGRLIKPVASFGYQSVSLCRGGAVRRKLVHRLVAEAFLGPAPQVRWVAHNNGRRADNRVENLRWATRKENEADKVLHGTSVRGGRNWTTKLTESAVRQIRKELARGGHHEAIAGAFNVARKTIYDIAHRKTWAWLT